MNGEIYSMGRNKSDIELINKELPDIIYELEKKGIRLLYKTVLDYSPKKILSALDQTIESNDNIKIIFIFNGLTKTDNNPSIMFYEKICDYIDTNDYQNHYLTDENINSHIEFDEDNEKESQKKINKKSNKTSLELYSLGDLGNGFEACFAEYNNIKIVSLPRSNDTGKTLTEMMLLVVDRLANPELVPEKENSIRTYNGFYYYKYEKIRNSFLGWKTYIPIKGDKPAEVIRKVIFLSASITVLVTAILFVNSFFIEPAKVQDQFDKIKGLYTALDISDVDQIVIKDEAIEGGTPSSDTLEQFKNIVTINDDFSGWIYIPNTTYIDYPVMYRKTDSKDNYFYLFKDFTGAYSPYGSIFVDYRCTAGTASKNVILHGHHMDNGMMFGEILNYSSLDFYKSAPVIEFNSLNQKNKWKIFAVYKLDTDDKNFFNYLQGQFASESAFMNYVHQVKARSLINAPVTINENDQILTLSTCSYEFGRDFRTIVVARKVRDGESDKVNTSLASYNSNPLWPAIHYKKNGGKAPKVSSFESTLRKNKGLAWYDGDGYLDGVSIDPSIYYVEDSDSEKDTDSTENTSSDTSSNTSSDSDNMSYIPDDNNSSSGDGYTPPESGDSTSDTEFDQSSDMDSSSDAGTDSSDNPDNGNSTDQDLNNSSSEDDVSTDSNEPVEPSDPPESEEPIVSSEPTEPVDPIESSEPTEPIEDEPTNE